MKVKLPDGTSGILCDIKGTRVSLVGNAGANSEV